MENLRFSKTKTKNNINNKQLCPPKKQNKKTFKDIKPNPLLMLYFSPFKESNMNHTFLLELKSHLHDSVAHDPPCVTPSLL